MKLKKLGDICVVSSAGDKPTDFTEIKTAEHTIPVIANGIEDDGIIGYTSEPKISRNAVTISARGNIGTAFYRNYPYYPVIRLISVYPKNDSEIDCQYLYYLLKNSPLKSIGSSVQAQLTVPIASDVDLFIEEDYRNQQLIAAFLGTIDDKISTNNKIIETSEKLMREIYDYWFVQFDFPNENGRPYKSSGGEMVYNETLKREIPKGWSAIQLRNIADVKSGFSFSSDDYVSDGEYKIITIKNVQDGFIDYDTDNTIDFVPDKMPVWCELGSSEILMSLTGNTGRIGLTFGEKALLNQRVAKIEPKDNTTNPFLYALLGSDFVQNKIQGLSSGSSQKNLSPIQLSNIYVTYNEECADKLSELLAPSVEMVVQKYSENRKLVSLRDWLLPMLMNGQIKVSD